MVQTTLSAEEIEYILEEARYGELESLESIFKEIDNKLLLTIKDEDESTVLHMAAGNGHIEVVKFILSILEKLAKNDTDCKKSFVDGQNRSGNTALHWASLNGKLEVVKLLCDRYDADAFIKNKAGHDSIYEAENNNKEDVEDYLLQKFSIEFDDEDEDRSEVKSSSEPTFTPGKEIDEVTKEAVAAKNQFAKEKLEKEKTEKTNSAYSEKDNELIRKVDDLQI